MVIIHIYFLKMDKHFSSSLWLSMNAHHFPQAFCS